MVQSTKTREDALLGQTIDGRFRLDEKLGEGAVGRVYRAVQLSIDRPVAIKVLHGEFRRDEGYQKRFRREANAISSFNHPNIVRLIDYGEDDKRELTYLAMEYVEGLELYDLLQKGRLDPRCALESAHQIAAGLSAAHGAGIIHRDLKASNIILVSVPGGIFQAKVLDFGVAFPRNNDVRMTADGSVFGTPAYMSPEQTRGRAVEAPSDLYALGVVLYEMLTGTLPFEADNSLRLMMKHIEEEPPTLAENLPYDEVPEGLQGLLDRFLEKPPEARFQDGEQVRRHIREVREHNGWGGLEVDTSLSLEEALSKWVLPRPAPEVTTAEQSGGRSAPEYESGPRVEPPQTGTERTGVETGVQPARTSSSSTSAPAGSSEQQSAPPPDPNTDTSEASQPLEAAETSAQRARSAPGSTKSDTPQSSADSIEGLKRMVVVLFAIALLFGGGVAGYALFAEGDSPSDGSASKSEPTAPSARSRENAAPARTGSTPDASPSRPTPSGGEARAEGSKKSDATEGEPARSEQAESENAAEGTKEAPNPSGRSAQEPDSPSGAPGIAEASDGGRAPSAADESDAPADHGDEPKTQAEEERHDPDRTAPPQEDPPHPEEDAPRERSNAKRESGTDTADETPKGEGSESIDNALQNELQKLENTEF